MKKVKLTKIVVSFLMLFLIVIMITGCGNKTEDKKLVGIWTDEKETFTYEFKSDGTAIMNGKEASYSIEEDTITIKYNDSTKLFTYKYTINNTSLTLENEAGNKYVYVKK